MRIPDIQQRLRVLAHMHGIAELRVLADHLSRRNRTVKAAPSSATMTPQLAKDIKAYKASNPGLSQREIAIHFNVNPGRVSEVLIGKRK